ncbi:MAG: hypothetical protein IJC93_04205 [Clostridia bacterium]|nr:hypothetical protein [Clostridia bacterium]
MRKRTKIVIVILVAVIMALRGVYIVTRFSAVTRYLRICSANLLHRPRRDLFRLDSQLL